MSGVMHTQAEKRLRKEHRAGLYCSTENAQAPFVNLTVYTALYSSKYGSLAPAMNVVGCRNAAATLG